MEIMGTFSVNCTSGEPLVKCSSFPWQRVIDAEEHTEIDLSFGQLRWQRWLLDNSKLRSIVFNKLRAQKHDETLRNLTKKTSLVLQYFAI